METRVMVYDDQYDRAMEIAQFLNSEHEDWYVMPISVEKRACNYLREQEWHVVVCDACPQGTTIGSNLYAAWRESENKNCIFIIYTSHGEEVKKAMDFHYEYVDEENIVLSETTSSTMIAERVDERISQLLNTAAQLQVVEAKISILSDVVSIDFWSSVGNFMAQLHNKAFIVLKKKLKREPTKEEMASFLNLARNTGYINDTGTHLIGKLRDEATDYAYDWTIVNSALNKMIERLSKDKDPDPVINAICDSLWAEAKKPSASTIRKRAKALVKERVKHTEIAKFQLFSTDKDDIRSNEG